MDIRYIDYPKFGPMTPRSGADITDLIIHHSAGPADQDPRAIDEEHRQRGMAGIAYNWIITHDGEVYSGRPIIVVPAAAYGRNQESVNVCLTGNFMESHPTPQQLQALKELAVFVHGLLPHIVRTIGHREVATIFYPHSTSDYATACPGDNLQALIPEVKAYVKEHLHSAT